MEDFSLEEYNNFEKVMADEKKLIEDSMKKARKYINEQRAAGTIAKNNEAERRFSAFAATMGEKREMHKIPAKKLASIKFFPNSVLS